MSNGTKPNRIRNPFSERLREYQDLDSLDKRRYWGQFLINNALYFILIILIVYTAINKPEFISFSSIIDIIKRTSYSLFMALGVGGAIVLTGTDLSAGRTQGLVACICASLLQKSDYANKMFPDMGEWPVIAVFLLALLVGGLIGLFNGFFVAKFSLHPFIVTLATQMMLYGGVLIYMQLGTNSGRALSGLNDAYNSAVNGTLFKIGGAKIPMYVLYAVIAIVVMWVIWNKTTFGKNMFAVGSNPEAANVSGVNVMLTIILVFGLAGLMYGMNGFVEAARVGSNNASTGLNAETDAIAACVIGGVSFTGGVGKVSGIVVGVILLSVIGVALQWLSISANLQYIIKGAIILFAVTLDMRKYLVKK